MQEQIRLTDLAKRAGVSVATVSRVLNGRPGVAPETRSQVLAALQRAGYTPGDAPTARLVGLITPEVELPGGTRLLQALQGRLGSADYTPVLASHGNSGSVAWAVDTLMRRKVAGLIVMGPKTLGAPDRAALGRINSHNLPLVLVDIDPTDIAGSGITASAVRTDQAGGVRLAIEHLQSLGHQRIGLLTDQVSAAALTDAFASAVPDGPVVHTLDTVASGESAAKKLVQTCTAVIAASEILAIGTLRAAQAAGRHVPAAVSVIAAADSPLTAYASPALTSIRAPVEELARTASDLILASLVSPGTDQPTEALVLTPELIVRQSSDRAKEHT